VPQTVRGTGTRKTTKAKTYRFDARLNEDQKYLIQRAADMEGRSMTDFVIQSAEEAAKRTVEHRSMWILSAHDTEIFVNALLNPPEPGPVLRKVFREHRKFMGSR
jgi:uncharacterized protein (DUF1778 family)